ncbi:hypothetical protein BC830DRAFT_170111 [Chytriomyces sp. MP71]|nr:hypothetical protein BC830DRAFT_170111 [Chytriomyces sp. MP71]
MSQAANQKVMPFLPELQNAKDPDFVPRYYVALPLFSIGLLLNSLVLTTILRNRDRLLQTRLDALVALLLCTFVYWSASCVALLVILVLVYDGDPMRRILAGNVSFTGGAIMACNLLLAGERFAAFYKARLMSASASAREGVPDGVGAESALRSEQADSLDPALGWQNRGAYAMYPNPMRRAGDLQQRSLFNFAEPFLDPSPSFVGQMMSEGVVHDWIDCDDAAQRLSSAQKMTESMVPNVTVSPRDSQLNSSISRTVSWETWYLRVIVGYFLIYWIIVIYVFSTPQRITWLQTLNSKKGYGLAWLLGHFWEPLLLLDPFTASRTSKAPGF